MDAFSGIVAWLLVVFLQTCPIDQLAKGQVYTFTVVGKLRTVSITIEELDAQAKHAIIVAELDPTVIDKDPRTHDAVLSWSGGGRSIKEMRSQGNRLLTQPLKLPMTGLLMSANPNDLLEPSKKPGGRAKSLTIEGYKGEIKPTVTRYEHGKDYADVSVDPTLGLLTLAVKQADELTNVELKKVKR